jgi:predicted methyltransferase
LDPSILRRRGTRRTGLQPGGFYVIVDHAAAAGSGTGDAQSLHRIDPASVREEVEAAGFVLDAESTMLANKDDPHSIKVFDPSIKGRDRSLRLSVREALTGPCRVIFQSAI